MTTEASMAPPRDMTRIAFITAGLAGLWVAAHAAGLLGPLNPATFPILSIITVSSILIGVRCNNVTVRWPWYWIAAGVTLFFFGGVARAGYETLGVISADRNLIPDIITIPGYLICAVGFFGIVRSRQRGRDNEMDALLDASVAALAAMALGWVFVVNPTLLHQSPLSVRVVLAAYPTLSMFLVALTASFAFTGASRGRANKLLLVSMAFVLFGDIVYTLIETHTISLPSDIIDLPYAISFVILIGAVLHPSVESLTTPATAAETAPTLGRLVVVAVALAIPGLITIMRVDAPTPDRIAMGVIVLALTAAAIARLFRAVKAHARSEARLTHQATHDMLTGLPNRAYVHEFLGDALTWAREHQTLVTLLFLDVDRFKLVNDSYGHTHGDAFLLAVARRLRESTRPTDLVARIGGDEFVIVVKELRGETEALDVAERTRKLFSEPFEVRGAEIASSVSIGVSIANGRDPESNAESMIRDADPAMYGAKESGRDAVAIFDVSMRDRVSKRLDLERDLHHALERGELELFYQPIVDMASGRVRGFEALLRWQHPAWGMISPLSFIPVAEETGMIVEIGGWVIDEACRQMAIWQTELPRGEQMTISVNLSARQLRDQSIVGRVQNALGRSGLRREALTLELTESTLMENPANAAELLTGLKDLGVHLAIDDFGTGYSSLAYLRRFPVDIVKIDRAFIIDLENEDSADGSLVAAIVAMADALGVTTVAEGVETETQAERLLALGCTVAQGYLYSRPAPVETVPEITHRLEARARARLRPVRDAFSA